MKKCDITGKSSMMVGGYSNKTRATKFNPSGMKRKKANIHRQKVFVPELGKSVLIKTTPSGLKTIKKNGAYKTLKEKGIVK